MGDPDVAGPKRTHGVPPSLTRKAHVRAVRDADERRRVARHGPGHVRETRGERVAGGKLAGREAPAPDLDRSRMIAQPRIAAHAASITARSSTSAAAAVWPARTP